MIEIYMEGKLIKDIEDKLLKDKFAVCENLKAAEKERKF